MRHLVEQRIYPVYDIDIENTLGLVNCDDLYYALVNHFERMKGMRTHTVIALASRYTREDHWLGMRAGGEKSILECVAYELGNNYFGAFNSIDALMLSASQSRLDASEMTLTAFNISTGNATIVALKKDNTKE